MRRAFLLLPILFISFELAAQTPTLLISGDNEFRQIEDFTPDPKVEGEFRLHEKPIPMSLYLVGTADPYKVPAANINLLDHAVLLTYAGSEVVIKAQYVDSITWSDHRMINSRHLAEQAMPDRLLRILARGSTTLLLQDQRMDLLPPTYNESLQLGNKNYTLEESVDFFLLDRVGELLALSKSLKDFKRKPYAKELKAWVKAANLDFKDPESLKRLAAKIDEYEGQY